MDLIALVNAIKPAPPQHVDAVVVLGSGLGGFLDRVDLRGSLDLSTVPGYPAATVAGHAGSLHRCRAGEKDLLLFAGRLHGYEGHPPDVAALPALVAASLGARVLVVTNAAGGIDPRLRAGDLMLITDLLVLPLAARMGLPLQGLGHSRAPGTGEFEPPRVRLPRISEEHLAIARRAAADSGVRLEEGSYGFCSGPTYETRAEIGFLRRSGVSAVGMSTVPEFLAAAAARLPVIGISCITNQASEVPTAVSHEEVTRVAAEASERLSRLLLALLAALPG